MTAAQACAPEVLRAGYAQLLPCMLTSLDTLSASADVSTADHTLERLLTLVAGASKEPKGKKGHDRNVLNLSPLKENRIGLCLVEGRGAWH